MKDYPQLCRSMDIRSAQGPSNDTRQSSETFTAIVDGQRRKYSMHDYRSMYSIPDLYDAMMYGMLGCDTPRRLAAEFKSKIAIEGLNEQLRILDIGAGSGAFAEHLRDSGLPVDKIMGLDIFPQAREAALRDRPAAYDDYLLCDLTNLAADEKFHLDEFAPNCVAVASATGWGNHIPVEGFQNAFDMLSDRGWFVFHVKPDDPDPECVALNEWIDGLVADNKIDNISGDEIFHRWNTSGDRIHYSYVIGRKTVN